MTRQNIMIAVVDGQGGRIGKALTEKLKKAYPDIYLRALGTNALATAAMLKGGADDGATGENAIVLSAGKAHIIVGALGIIMSNSMMGELTPAMASAIGNSDAVKVLLPVQRCNIRLAISTEETLQRYIDNCISLAGEEISRLLGQA